MKTVVKRNVVLMTWRPKIRIGIDKQCIVDISHVRR